MTTEDTNETVSAADYDDFAAAYEEANENGLFNAWYERPRCCASPATSRACECSTPGACRLPGRPPALRGR